MTKSKRLFKKRKTIPPSKKSRTATPEVEPPNIENVESADGTRSTPGSFRLSHSAQASSAEKKCGSLLGNYGELESDRMYDIVDVQDFGNSLASVMCCKVCGGQVDFTVETRVGVAAQIRVSCLGCVTSMKYQNSERIDTQNKLGKSLKMYALNLRTVYGMRIIGKGRTAARKFFSIMNLPPPPTKFDSYERALEKVVEETCKADMKNAVLDAVEENEGDTNLTVAFDGSWQKRGHTSLNGVVTATCGLTNKVIDVEIMSKFCSCKGRLVNKHISNCSANFSGSSGGMEVEGVVRMFMRSQEQYPGVKYTRYLGDGDSKGYQAVCNAKPYGPDINIEKIECIGHVQKRMRARLRNFKKKMGDTKLSDGKNLGSRGRLTDEAINNLQLYYGLAIRRHTNNNLAEMNKAVWASYLHILSIDKNPCHEFCSQDWCKYLKAQEENKPYRHSEHFHLPAAVMQAIKPIYVSLSSPDLLRSCLHGKTQNYNESMNNVIWSFIPKRSFVSLRVLQLGTYAAVLSFNKGNIGICDVLRGLGIEPGKFCAEQLKILDHERITRANRAAQECTKEGRVKKTKAAKRLEEQFEEEEGEEPAYGAGLHLRTLLLIAGGWLILGILHTLSAIQYTPFDGSVDPSECALVLNQYSDANLLANNYPFGAPPTCITYDAVDQAYLEARKRIQIKTPPADTSDVVWPAEHTAKVGELLLDISTQLAKTYGMGSDDIEKGLPLIDTSKTLIREICPAYLSDVQCHAGKYRRHDGLCNNLDNPTWGAMNTPFTRLMAPHFADGMNQPRESITGNNLPLPRIVSRTIHPDEGYHDHAGTVMIVAWGQFMDHDFTLTATPLDRHTKNEPEECCNRPAHLRHPYCMDVVIPEDDYFYKKFGVKCQDFVRSFPAPRPGCRLGSKVPFNTLTGVIDGNTIYGVTEQFSRHLRSGYSGLLRMNPVFSEFGLKELLPLKLDIPEEGCTRANGSEYCFEAGEIRVNEQLVLACMHTIMAREHNRIAKELAKINPHWDDETLYQESRRIVIAEIQQITFNEFLPIVLGKEVMEKFGLVLEKEGHWDGYDENINPNIIDAFSAAAFRFGHSLLPTAVERWSKAHKFIASKRLSDLIRRPYDLYRAGVMDEYLMGLMNQVAQAMDDSITQEVTNHLLKKPGHHFGLDLVAFNMQRGREFGVPGYMYFRKFCGLPAYDEFEDLFGSMPNSTVHRYQSIYQSTMDVDLWSGGVSEKPLPGSLIGSTFACIIATQMSYVRRGDRFWYELPNQPSSFTAEQLREIKKIKLSRVLCDNTDLIDTIQVYPMVLPDYEINPRVPCKSGILPRMDLTKWAEYDPSGGVGGTVTTGEANDEDGKKLNTDEEQGTGEEEYREKHEEEDQEQDDGERDEANDPERDEEREEESKEHNSDDDEPDNESEEESKEELDEERHLDNNNNDGSREAAEGETPPRYTKEFSSPSNSSTEKAHYDVKSVSGESMTKAIPLGTFNKTKIYIPVVIPQKYIKPGNNKAQTIKSGDKTPGESGGSTVSSVVKASSKLEIKNTKIKPLKYDENFTILVAKKNKVIENSKGNDTKSKQLKRERRRARSYENDSGSRQYSAESDESEERDSGSSDIRDADHDYDSDYEYVRPDGLRSPEENGPSDEAEPSGPSGPADTSEPSDISGPSGPSAPDAYDIHGYRGEQKTTHWPPNSQVQPAYALTEGKSPTPHLKSGRPQTFKQPMRDYGSGHHRHPGGATSSSTFNMGSNEHHHHHFYDRLKETHANKPKDYHHTTKFLIPPDVYRKYPGKHKHFHHVKTPEGQQVIEEPEEDDPNFDPNTLTDKDHEEAFNTYDEEEVAVDVNYDDSDRPPLSKKDRRPTGTTRKPSPRLHTTKKNEVFTSKHMVQYRNPGGLGRMSGSQNKAEVERIFDAVERAMRKENVAMKSSQSMNISPTGSAIMWPLGFPRGLDLKQNP